MTPSLRRYFIDQLIKGLAAIGPDVEIFGQRLVDRIVDVPMQHPGLNQLGHPVGHTVDSVSATGEIVAEYSTDESYFSGRMEKLRGDFKHARRMYPKVRKILLVSNRVCGPKASTRLTRRRGQLQRRCGIESEIYDARRIAEFIVDYVLLDDVAVEQLAPFLGPLDRIRNEYVITHLVPEPAYGYIPRPLLEAEIGRRLEVEKVVTLAGMSGLGKSQTAAATARSRRGQYDMVVWLNAASVRSVQDLHAIEIDRRGRKVNLLPILRDRSCLLILDDLQASIPVDDLKSACGPQSCALITRQAAQTHDVKMPPLNREEAQKLINHDLPTPCPTDIFELVWRTVGGHPLALRLMNAGVRNGSWDELIEDCRVIGEYRDEDKTQRLADRLLGRLRHALPRELGFFRWCGTTRADRAFARRALAPVGVRKLDEACLLASDRADVLRLHDIVKASLATLALPFDTYAAEFATKLEDQIEAVSFREKSDLGFLNLCHVHRDKLEELARSNPNRDAYLYCLLKIWNPSEVDLELTGKPIERAHRIAATAKPVSDMAVSTVLEAVEALYRKRKHGEGTAAAHAELESHLEVFNILEKATGVSGASRSRVCHHHAKALKILGRKNEAVQVCEGILAGPHPLPTTMLLLARLLMYNKDTVERSRDLLLQILEMARTSPSSVETSLVLAATEEMGRSQLKTWFPDVSSKYGQIISERIVASAVRGFDQAFLAFASIGRHWQWNDRSKFINVFSELPPWSVEDAHSDQQRAAWGDILLSASKAVESTRRDGLLREALAFYEALQRPDPFNLQQKGQTLVLLGKFNEAIQVLEETFKTKPNQWNRYWLSKARLGIGDAKAALALIDEVCKSVPPEDTFLATYLDHRFDVRTALGDPHAVEDLEQAYATCKDLKYKASLQRKLDEVRIKTVEPVRGAT